jgi:hypothetical protein
MFGLSSARELGSSEILSGGKKLTRATKSGGKNERDVTQQVCFKLWYASCIRFCRIMPVVTVYIGTFYNILSRF